MAQRTKALMNPHRPGEPAVRQPPVAGWDISYNPEEKTWHVDDPITAVSVRTYADRRNALAWARKNPR